MAASKSSSDRLSMPTFLKKRHYECVILETVNNGVGFLYGQIPILIIPIRLGFAARRREKLHSVILRHFFAKPISAQVFEICSTLTCRIAASPHFNCSGALRPTLL